MYDLDPTSVRNFLTKESIETVAIQLPSGLRPEVSRIKRIFDEEGVDVLFLSDACYGACDIAGERAKDLGCDALIHYGHSDMDISTPIPTLYVEARIEADPFKALERALPELRDSVWGLTATVQHVQYLEGVEEFLEGEGIESRIGDPGSRAKYPGQILGCDWGSARSVEGEVDGFIYLGTGKFHPFGIFLATRKPVISVNPLTDGYEIVKPEIGEFLRKRYAMLSRAESCQRFGVLVSTKPGQSRLSLSKDLERRLEEHGYDAYVLIVDEVDPQSLGDYDLEAFVNTACPRLPIDDAGIFDVPILTPFEVEVLLGEKEWDHYGLDELGRESGE